MTPAEALDLIKGYASTYRLTLTRHAKQRAAQRGAGLQHVRHALINAVDCIPGDPDGWRVSGPDLDGDTLTAAVVIGDGLIVVTLF